MKIIIAGYQAVEHPTTLEINGFTVIMGESNIGKSSAFRAAIAPIINQKGNSFITVGKEEANTTYEIPQHTLTWTKTHNSVNYKLDGELHNKAGRATPTDLLQLLGFKGIQAQNKTYYPQIQRQFAQPFIISEASPTTAAELLSATKEAQILARAIKIAQKDHNTKTTEVELRQEALHRYRTTLQKSKDDEESLTALMNKAHQTTTERKTSQERLEALKSLKNRYRKLQVRIDETKRIPVVPPDPIKTSTLQCLTELRSKHQKLLERAGKLKEVTKTEPTLSDHRQAQEKLNTLKALRGKYSNSLETRRTLLPQLEEIDDTDEELETRKQEALQALGYCPTCKQRIHPNSSCRSAG